MGRGEASDRRPRPRALVHDRLPPRAARRRLAGDAGALAWIQVAAVQLFRPQPRARCAAAGHGSQMRLAPTILAAVLAAVSVSDQLRAGDSIEPAVPSALAAAATLLYLDQSHWRQ